MNNQGIHYVMAQNAFSTENSKETSWFFFMIKGENKETFAKRIQMWCDFTNTFTKSEVLACPTTITNTDYSYIIWDYRICLAKCNHYS